MFAGRNRQPNRWNKSNEKSILRSFINPVIERLGGR